jgi:hypothetical protein
MTEVVVRSLHTSLLVHVSVVVSLVAQNILFWKLRNFCNSLFYINGNSAFHYMISGERVGVCLQERVSIGVFGDKISKILVYISPHSVTIISIFGLLLAPVATFSIFRSVKSPSTTRPKTTLC